MDNKSLIVNFSVLDLFFSFQMLIVFIISFQTQWFSGIYTPIKYILD